jgi:hypothetical protein
MASGIDDDDIHGSLGDGDLQMQTFYDFSMDDANAVSDLDFWDPSWDRPSAPLQRARYGTGIDARRTAPFHGYPIEHSELYQFLKGARGEVTKNFLLRLVTVVVDSAPPGSGLTAPGRTLKRIKCGLVCWLDENAPLAWAYLRRHGLPE